MVVIKVVMLVNYYTYSITFTIYSKSMVISQDRPKSAPYLRFKNSKRTSKCKVFFFTVPGKPKSWTEFARQGGGLEIFHPFCRKTSKIEGDPLKSLKY